MESNQKLKIARLGVGVMIIKDNQVLLGRRHDDRDKADSELEGQGTWTMPGGKVDFGNTLIEEAYREVLEETGIEIDKNKLKLISITDDIIETAHFVTIGFLCQDFESEPKAMEPDEITEWQWFGLDQLPERIFPPSEKIIKNYLSRTIYNY